MAISGTKLSDASASTITGADLSDGFELDASLDDENWKPVHDFMFFTVDIDSQREGTKLSEAV